MHKIQDLFDSSKKLDRKIESVVTFGAKDEVNLSSEIKEYVVTEKLQQSYENVIRDLQTAFNDGTNKVGIWVSGFYGSGKSSFAKYLGLSFDKSVIIDGVTFGDRLMSRIHDTAIAAEYHTLVSRHDPLVVMIDLSTQATAGKISFVSDIVYNETLKQMHITSSTDEKVMCFINLLYSNGKYEDFCNFVETEKGMKWEEIESDPLLANLIAGQLAHKILPQYFSDVNDYNNIKVNSAVNEEERFKSLYEIIRQRTGKEKVIFVLDEVGQYIASDVDKILNVQGMLQIFKDQFKGNVMVIATAQQTLTEDNRAAMINSTELFRLNDRFPIKVDIEANDIKEIITKRLLGKSPEGKKYLVDLFKKNEGQIKLGTNLKLQDKSIYNQILDEDNFSNLYPFMPVHIDILLSLLQNLASRTGGVGLRSVIRLIRDILVDNHLAEASIGKMACPAHFYDALHSDMEKNTTKEIVMAADKAINVYKGNALAENICKTIAVMQILEDFVLSFDNICALLYNNVGEDIDKVKVREILDELTQYDGLTLQEIEGKYQFMTNAILGIREERNKIVPRDLEKADVLKDILKNKFTPAPSVNIYSSKTITAGIELNDKGKTYPIQNAQNIKINIRFVDASSFKKVHNEILSESTRHENNRTLFWICTMDGDKEILLQDIVRSQNIRKRHNNETNKEIVAYLRAQENTATEKMLTLTQMITKAMENSEIIFQGTPEQVNTETYKTVALKHISEKIFEKYPFASVNMNTNCVKNLAEYRDTVTVPASLNPLGIIKNDGSIDVTHRALSEIKDFISLQNEVTGTDIVRHFEDTPYGWSKDTIRYLVALMLKASIVQLRDGGNDIKVLGDKAVNAMGSNPSFMHINVSLNTSDTLSLKELMKAAMLLVQLFNTGRIAPLAEQIAINAHKAVKKHYSAVSGLLPRFESMKLAATPILKQAAGYMERIINSEGAEAPYLLCREPNCEKTLRYAFEVIKYNNNSALLDNLAHVKHLIEESDKLINLSLTAEYKSQVKTIETLYNKYIANEDIVYEVSNIADLKNQLDAYLKDACTEFVTSAEKQIGKCRSDVRETAEYSALTDRQKTIIDAQLDSLTIENTSNTIDSLRDMSNKYSEYTNMQGTFYILKQKILEFTDENIKKAQQATNVKPEPETPYKKDGEPQDNNGGATTVTEKPVCMPKRIAVKRRLSTRADVEQLIKDLQDYLDNVGENTPIELIF